MIERAFAKVNLSLALGPTRPDGRHELVTLFSSVDLVDELKVCVADADQVICAGVDGPNLVSDALAGLRAAGWNAPPIRVTITKRIPVAAGMGGGSADAAALLRCAPRLGSVDRCTCIAIAARLGADVPGQLEPGPSLGTGAGELVSPFGELPPHAVLVLPQPFGLSTAAVYREADRLGLARAASELAAVRSRLMAALTAALPAQLPVQLPAELVVNDLQPAAVSLAPAIEHALTAAVGEGADQALVCGSGPTVIGLFWGADGLRHAGDAAQRLRSVFPGAVAAAPIGRGVGPSATNASDQ